MANKITYFECEVEGHEDNILNVVCIDNTCNNKGLICTMCQYYSHQNHVQKPLKVFLNDYKSVLMKVTKETPQLMKNSQDTPNPQMKQSGAQLNLKKCKQVYDTLIQKIEDYQSQIQDQFNNIYNEAKSYYEEQIYHIKKMSEQNSKDQRNVNSPTMIVQEFLDQGKQIVESIERSVPIKPEEQRNLVSILAQNVNVENSGQMNWKNMNIIKNEPKKENKQQSNLQEKIENSILMTESNLQGVSRNIESFCKNIDANCSDLISKIITIKSEIIQSDIQNDNQASKQNEQPIQNKSNNDNKNNNFYLQKVQQKQNNSNDLDTSFQNKQNKSNEQQQKDKSYEDKFSHYLDSRKKEGIKLNVADKDMLDENDEQNTSNFSKVKRMQELENKTTEKKNLDSSGDISPPSQPIVARGYAQRLTSLNKLNKPGINRANSSLSELFNSTGENEDGYKSNQKLQQKSNDYLESFQDKDLKDKQFPVIGEESKNSLNPQDEFQKPRSNSNANSNSKLINQNPQFNIQQKFSIKAHKSMCKDLVFIDESRIATCSYDCFVKIWDLQSGKLIKEIKLHNKRINSITYSSKYNLLVSTSDDSKAIAYKDLSADCWEEVFILNHDNNSKIQCCAFYDQEDQLICGQEDGEVQVWNIQNGQKIKKLESCKEKILCLRIINDKKQLLGVANQSIYVWKLQSSKIIYKKSVHKETINDILFLRHGGEDCFATAGDDHAVKIWSLKDYSILTEFYEQDCISSMQYSPLTNTLLISVWGEKPCGYVSFWNLHDTKKVDLIRDKSDGITKIKYFDDQNLLAVGVDNGLLEVYSISQQKK